MFLSIGAAACFLGVSISTLRRWELQGKFLPSFRTAGGHRRYSIVSVQGIATDQARPKASSASKIEKQTVLYSRVSSSDQKLDLKRQTKRLKQFAKANKYKNLLILEDLGSGINYRKPGLTKLLNLILLGKIDRICIHHKDRLLRFGSELIFKICEYSGINVDIIEEEMHGNFEQELACDVLELMTVFSARLYGRRSHLNRTKKQSGQTSRRAS